MLTIHLFGFLIEALLVAVKKRIDLPADTSARRTEESLIAKGVGVLK